MIGRSELISFARQWIGYKGKADKNLVKDGGLYTVFAESLDKEKDWYNGKKNGYDWCGVFYDYLFVKTFGKDMARKMLYRPTRSLSAGVKYAYQYYEHNGAIFKEPQMGDQIFFYNVKDGQRVYTHTGIVECASMGYVYTIEGNAGNPSAVRAERYVQGSRLILGYGRPNWEALSEKEENTMEPVSSWAKEAWDWAIAKGICDGTFPKDPCTREQVVVMLHRLYKELSK